MQTQKGLTGPFFLAPGTAWRGRCSGSAKVIAGIEYKDVTKRILAHLRDEEQEAPGRPLLVSPTSGCQMASGQLIGYGDAQKRRLDILFRHP